MVGGAFASNSYPDPPPVRDDAYTLVNTPRLASQPRSRVDVYKIPTTRSGSPGQPRSVAET